MRKMVKKTLLLLVLGGCMVGPNYQPPETCVNEIWITPPSDLSVSTHPALAEWWDLFEDPLLSRYICLAQECNQDVLTAMSNVMQARALRRVVASAFYPQIGVDVNATRTYFSKNGPVFAIGPSTGSVPGTVSNISGLPFAVQNPQIQNLFNALLEFSWEIDLFGKTRRAVEAADAMIESTMEQMNGVLISVMAEIASNYMELRSLQQSEKFVEENICLLEKKACLVREQYKYGYVSLLDAETIEAKLYAEKAKLPDIHSQIHQHIYVISVLTGCPPETLLEELTPHQPLPKVPPHVAIGLKSDLLRRRPDVREAERNLAAATANIGVAVASFFPTFTLIGDAGLQSLALNKLFSWRSRTWAIGADLSTPIFQGGRLRGNLEASYAETDAAFHIYQQTVLKALEEAESTLMAFIQSHKAKQDRGESTKHYEKLTCLSKMRMCQGLTNLLDYLNALLNLNQSEQDELDTETATLLNLISLYKALGGSCQSCETCDPCLE